MHDKIKNLNVQQTSIQTFTQKHAGICVLLQASKSGFCT